MLLPWRREKDLKTVWKLTKNGKASFLVGTAHFFPYSVRGSLVRLFHEADTVIFEGPLDEDSMAQVRAAGVCRDGEPNLLHLIDEPTREKIRAVLSPACRSKSSAAMLKMLTAGASDPVNEILGGMKPWLAFFTIYLRFLETMGWKHSVDREAYHIAREMGKEVVFLETIEEQIQVLESLSVPQIADFISRIDLWKKYTKQFVSWYLSGDVERIKSNRVGFPTRHPEVIDRRDEIFVERSDSYFKKGRTVFCVGVPHVVNMNRMLSDSGYRVELYSP
jgi:hypothetical protein